MLIKRVVLINFRQFIGEQCIEFSSDKKRNVTVLVGRNTSGKTTLIRAFEWILYNQINFSDKILLNYNIVDNMIKGEEQTVTGILVIEHEGKEYTITRSLPYICTGQGTVLREVGTTSQPVETNTVVAGKTKATIEYLQADGQTKTPIEQNYFSESIERILPEGLSKYFFFGGERIASISSKADIEVSVKGLMGLDVLSNAMDHLRKVINRFKKGLDYAGDLNAQRVQESIDSKSQQLELLSTEFNNIQEQLDYYAKEKEKFAALLKANQQVGEDQKKREQLDKIVKDLEQRIEMDKDSLVQLFSRDAFSFFAMPLIKRAIELLNDTEDITDSIPEMNAGAIDYIINHRQRCICGRPITEGSDALKNLLSEKKKLPPEFIGASVRQYRETSSEYLTLSENYYEAIQNKYRDIRSNMRELGVRRDEIAALSSKIAGQKSIADLEDGYANADKRFKDMDNEKVTIIQKIGAIKKDIENLERSLQVYSKANAKNEKINACIDYTSAVFDWVQNAYLKKEGVVRQRLEEEVNTIFSHMYHGNRTIMIDEKYKVKYLDVTTEESDGLKAVKSFAFIAGLVSLAQKALDDDNDETNIGARYYPLVMDAPFSNIDEVHIENICKEIPVIAEQVIIAIMQKDWEYAEKTIQPFLGAEYSIEKDMDQYGKTIETVSHIKMVRS